MAYILRSLAIVGVIALNSPVHDDGAAVSPAKPGQSAGIGAAHAATPRPSHGFDLRKVSESASAAREAAEILAGLDPALREKVLAAGLRAGATALSQR